MNTEQSGIDIIKQFIKTLPKAAGVYRMFDNQDRSLYIGKAKNLPKRVVNYTNISKLPYRLQKMVNETAYMEFTKCATEADALLLEANLIKKLKPKYNILLRDDKSFPYIRITDHDFPQVTKHRGARKSKGQYFGPFASTGAVNRTTGLLQRVFMLRNCTDNVFKNRNRPCLQYQIKRCTAPCVNYVDALEYKAQVDMAHDFLKGKSRHIQDSLTKDMQDASDKMEFEKAALYRDRIQALTSIQSTQSSQFAKLGDADVMAIVQENGITCVQVFFYRGGQNFGNRAYFPRHTQDDTLQNILSAFISQFYENKPVPAQIISNLQIKDQDLIEQALSLHADKKVVISVPLRGYKKQIILHALSNAQNSLALKLSSTLSQKKIFTELIEIFDLPQSPERIEVYDNSHISGTHPVGAMIVAGAEGFIKNAYRKFNIKNDIAPGDDFAMMAEVFERRFKKTGKDAHIKPDIILIDGGAGQLSSALKILKDLNITDINVIGIAKGPDRNAGRERFFREGHAPFSLTLHHPVLHYLQRIRDEAHRFAIGTHRARRDKAFTKSPFDHLSGVGAMRKKALLLHFGSAKLAMDAPVSELEKVSGISKKLAQKIYDAFHE